MKLIVAGASGFVATEVVRQSLSIPKITSVIALARRAVTAPSNLSHGADVSKLHSVVVKDYDSYPDDVIKQLAGADACIWTVAITPRQAKGIEFDQVRRVCHDNAVAGLQAVFKAYSEGTNHGAQPLRFMYMSGMAAERDQNKTPKWEPQYCLLRGETENSVLAFAAEHKDSVEMCVAKPGLIVAQEEYLEKKKETGSVPMVSVVEVSAAMLHGVVDGFEKETLENEDLVRVGSQALKMAK